MDKINSKKIIFWILIIIGISVRIYNYPSAISEMNGDEIMTAINAKAIADTGKDSRRHKFSSISTWLGWSKRNLIISYDFGNKDIWI